MPAQLVKLDTTPDLVERVYRALLDAIVDGSLPSGARLTQEEIAGQLAVSRQPVLQALRMLKSDGLVLDAPGRGVLVAPLDGAWIASVYEVRAALDVLAARLAAQRRAALDPDLIERGRKAARGRNVRALIDADVAFHNAVYAASGNPLIEQSAHVHWRHVRRAMGAVLQKSTLRTTVWDEHEAIAQAIGRGDAERAARLMSGHDQRASEHMSRELGPRASPRTAEGDIR
ncbi:GntR family transcriptional regulator [Piscinibacter sp.]|uniref:GntR family transcriptional regulator n=1 Tax=Piscinibacter sp. TaxID=1903157 RepID=UPI002D174C35|nr:GntR family transcriptional regulator [Albitalea sp.]HUG25675.1 GntR family transcriptional regulator [Albitalea sp.]